MKQKREYRVMTGKWVLACCTALLMAGCVRDYHVPSGVGGEPVAVRVVAEIGGKTGVKQKALTKAGEWHEDHLPDEESERSVAHAFLFAYHGNTLVKTMFYYPAGTANPLTGTVAIPGFGIREMAPISAANPGVTLDLELPGGEYGFVLLVNSTAALEEVRDRQVLPDPRRLVEKNRVFTSADLRGNNRGYLPMTGQGSFHVPAALPGGDRITLSPQLNLERVHARVEFLLTTIDEAGEYLSPLLASSRVSGLTLRHEANGYAVLPPAGEYTVTGNREAVFRGAAYGAGNLPAGISSPRLPERESFHSGANTGTAPSAVVARCRERLLPQVDGLPERIYVAPGAYRGDEVMELVFIVRYPDVLGEKVYKIPLYNPDLSPSDAGYYHVRRNTVYRVNARLVGPDISEFDLGVVEWEDVEVAIPW